MDLALFEHLKDQHEAGAELALLDPAGNPTEAQVRIAGPDSDRHRDARHEMANTIRRLARQDKDTAEAREEAATRMLARLILGWSGLEDDGAPLPHSFDSALRLIRAYPLFRLQVDAFASNRGNFDWPEASAEAELDPNEEAA